MTKTIIGIPGTIRYPFLTTAALLLLLFVPAVAGPWNLEACLQYAHTHNVRIRSNTLDSLAVAADSRQAVAARFPGLSANSRYSASHSDDDFGTVAAGNGAVSQALNYSLNADLTLFDGLRTGTNIRRQRRTAEATAYTAAQTERDVSRAVIQAYLQALYAHELLGIAEQAHETSGLQLERTRQRRDAGAVSDIVVAQAASDLASDAYSLVTARNSRDRSILELKHLLELPAGEPFIPAFDETNAAPAPDNGAVKADILARAYVNSPAVRRDSLGIVIAQLDLKKTYAAYWPTLSLTGSVSGNNVIDGGAAGYASDSYNAALGLQLSLPLYDNRTTKTAVEKGRISVEQARLGLATAKMTLAEEVETAFSNAAASRSRLEAADLKVSAATTSYDLARQQYELGMLDPLDLKVEKNTFITAGTEQLQARYAVYLHTLLLNLYLGEPVTSVNIN